MSYPKSISARPTITVDAFAARLIDNVKPNPNYPGAPANFGRVRIVTALPTNNDGPVRLLSAVAFGDPLAYLVDPSGNFVGSNSALYIHRMVTARWVEDTRRLGG